MNPKNAKLTNAKLKILPLGKSVCDGNHLYFTRTGDGKGKFTYRYQRLGKRHEMGLGPFPAVSLAQARQRARDAQALFHKGLGPPTQQKYGVMIDKNGCSTGDWFIRDSVGSKFWIDFTKVKTEGIEEDMPWNPKSICFVSAE